MSQQKVKNNLINWDLVSVNPNDKNWDWKDLFCFWGVNVQSVIGFSLITSLYLIYDLNNDQLLNVLDIMIIVDSILDNNFIENGDFNTDGILNISDIIFLIGQILD